MGVKSDLAKFYSKNAKHYHQTRQKFWVDGEKILEQINALGLEKVRILELGCGSGRFLSYFKLKYQKDFEYPKDIVTKDFTNRLAEIYSEVEGIINTYVLEFLYTETPKAEE